MSGIAAGQLSPSLLPAVSFLKAPAYQDGHAFYSDPIDEQQFLVTEINALQQTPDWANTAVIVAYDDSDGWYDHAFSGITNPSQSVADALTGSGSCGNTQDGNGPFADEMGRCGYGPRLPLLVISPWARPNFADHALTNQASILRFIEDDWHLGRIDGSADTTSGTLTGMFNFSTPRGRTPSCCSIPPQVSPRHRTPSGGAEVPPDQTTLVPGRPGTRRSWPMPAKARPASLAAEALRGGADRVVGGARA